MTTSAPASANASADAGADAPAGGGDDGDAVRRDGSGRSACGHATGTVRCAHDRADRRRHPPRQTQLDALYDALRNWGRWGADDELGALNFLTPERRAAAGALVRTGRHREPGPRLPASTPSPETPSPAHHHMLASGDARDSNGIPGYEASRDYIGTEVHGMGITHLDALCHMFVRGEMYNGRPAADVKSTGALTNTVMATADGLAGRGVFLDIPRAARRRAPRRQHRHHRRRPRAGRGDAGIAGAAAATS